MTEVEFIYNGIPTIIQCNLTDKLENICLKFSTKMQIESKDLLFLHNGSQLNFDSELNQLKLNSEKIKILVYNSNNNVEKLSLKFNLKDINNIKYDIIIYFSLNLDIIAEYKDIFPKKLYKNSFSLEELKNKSKFFKIYDTVKESYNDIKSFLDQNTLFIQTKENSLSLGIKKQIGIAYDIIFLLKEEVPDLNDIVSELRKLNLENNNNEFNCKLMYLESKMINIENNNNELKLKNLNLEKKFNELEEKNNILEKKIIELYEKNKFILEKYNEIIGNKKINELFSNEIDEQNMLSKIQIFFDKPIKDINLIYKGFDRNIFFEKCAGKNNLLFLLKDKEGNEFGGFMSTKLEKNINDNLIIKDNNAFIFNVKNKKKFKVIKPENAISIQIGYLIAFGGSLYSGNDLYIRFNSSGGMNRKDNYGDIKYETSNGKSNFCISEFKVYHLNL